MSISEQRNLSQIGTLYKNKRSVHQEDKCVCTRQQSCKIREINIELKGEIDEYIFITGDINILLLKLVELNIKSARV